MKKISYKLWVLVPMFVLTGCGEKFAHKNIITGKVEKGNEKAFVIKDVKTNDERVYKIGSGMQARNDFDCFKIGDTISVYTGGVYRADAYYQENIILHSGEFGMSYNVDTINTRIASKRLEQLKKEMNTKQR